MQKSWDDTPSGGLNSAEPTFLIFLVTLGIDQYLYLKKTRGPEKICLFILSEKKTMRGPRSCGIVTPLGAGITHPLKVNS